MALDLSLDQLLARLSRMATDGTPDVSAVLADTVSALVLIDRRIRDCEDNQSFLFDKFADIQRRHTTIDQQLEILANACAISDRQ